MSRGRPTTLLYGGLDDESFHAKSPEGYLIDTYSDGNGVPAYGVEVVAYRRKTLAPEWVRRQMVAAFEGLVEEFEGEYGGDDSTGLEDAEDEFTAVAGRLFTRMAKKHALIWNCEEASRRIWSQAEVLALVGRVPVPEPRPGVPVFVFKRSR